MKVFLFSATGPAGEKLTDRVEAASLAQARYALELRGCRDIEFFTDENGADIERANRSGLDLPKVDPERWTAADELASHRRKGVAEKILWAAKQHAPIFGGLALWVGVEWFNGRPYGLWAWVAFLALPLYFLWFLRLVVPIALFDLILESAVWWEWSRLRRYLALTRLMNRFVTTGIPPKELDIREGISLAAQGRLAEGVALVEKYRGHPDLSEYLYLARLSGLYDAAKDYNRSVGLMEAAAAVGPGGVSEWIDVALARILRQQDAPGAREALAKIADKEVPALPQAFRLIVEGMIATQERDDLHAAEYFRLGLEKLAAVSGSPLTHALIAVARAHLVISFARIGHRDLARKILAQERPLLEARQETALLQRCDAALAG